MDIANFDEIHAVREAAEGGDPSAQATLGLAYELGHGVERDSLQASYLYRQAALAGEVRAQYALGLLYERGPELDACALLARHWYALAAERGHAGALRRLKDLDLYAAVCSCAQQPST